MKKYLGVFMVALMFIGVVAAYATDVTDSMGFSGNWPAVTFGDAKAEDTGAVFDGNADDFYFCLDDSADDLIIGYGSTCGTDERITLIDTETTILIGDGAAEDIQVRFDGNAQDFHIGLDDTADDLVIGVGSALGTTQALGVDENAVVTVTSSLITPSENVTAANVLTANECGKTFFLNSATEFASTLPTASTVSAGCLYRFIVAAAPSGADYTIITGNSLENTLYGTVYNGTGFDTQAAGDTITLVDGAAVVGDRVDITANGTNYFVTGWSGANTGISISQAD